MAITAALAFEQLIEKTFDPYLKALTARLYRMPPLFVPTHHRDKNGMPFFRLSGKGPFDVIGYSMNPYSAEPAVMVGAEVKCSTEPKASLPIIIPPRDGAGLDLHQLEALASIAMSNGIARIVWNNGGRVGILKEAGIILAYQTVSDAMESIMAKREVKSGVKSIKADLFVECPQRVIAGVPIYDWLDIHID